MFLRVFDKAKNLIKILGSSKQTVILLYLLNFYETKHAGKTNKGHCFAAKKNVLIVVI